MLGIGGGLIIVPSLVTFFTYLAMPDEIAMHMAIATSLGTIVFTSLSSVYTHHRHGAVLWLVVSKLTPGIVFGVLSGVVLGRQLPHQVLETIFGLFAILVAIQMIGDIKPAASRSLPGVVGMTLAGGGIGFVSSLVGIGGGTMTTPFLYWRKTSVKQAIATSAACGFPIAIVGLVGYIFAGTGNVIFQEWSSGYVYWPALIAISITSVLFAPLGARWTHYMPVLRLKRIFAILLIVVAARLLLLE